MLPPNDEERAPVPDAAGVAGPLVNGVADLDEAQTGGDV